MSHKASVSTLTYAEDSNSPLYQVANCEQDGTLLSGATYKYVKCPSVYTYELEDVSSSGAGRTIDGKMFKCKLRQVVCLSVEWSNITDADVKTLLLLFNSEYVSVKYWDALQGAIATKTFYVGNRTAPMYNSAMGLWSNLGFRIIEV